MNDITETVIVECTCGWMGKTRTLNKTSDDDIRKCPQCDKDFIKYPITKPKEGE